MQYILRQTESYLEDIKNLPSEIKRNQLPKTQRLLQENPRHPGLQTHQFQGFNRQKVFRSYIDMQYRVAWWYSQGDKSIILWRVGKHSTIDELDNFKNIPKYSIAKVIAPANQSSSKEKFVKGNQYAGVSVPKGIFSVLSPTHLRLFGVPDNLIDKLQRIDDIHSIFDLDLPKHTVQILISYYTHPEWTPDNILDIRQVFYRANADQLEEYCKGNIRQLMLDLSIEQERIVQTQANGVLLIKGVAGSGKTTVGIYRALYLAKNRRLFHTKPVLFLTYNEVLAETVVNMYYEISPKSEHKELSHSIRTSTIRDWCKDYLKEEIRIFDLNRANTLLSTAMSAVIPRTNEHQFLKQEYFIPIEISQVIKGRGVKNWEEYKVIKRVGRGQPLQENQRKIVWDIYCNYQQKLKIEGILDEGNLILESLKKIKNDNDFEPYSEVVVDEAQDLPPKSLELAAALAGGGSSFGLSLLADPSQSIYYKGISWKDGNIQIHSSRVKTLTKNFRNTKQILEVAWSLSKADPDQTLNEAIEPDSSNKLGLKPELFYVNNQSDQDLKCLKELIIKYSGSNRYRMGDIAVLVRKREKITSIESYLKNANIPVCHYRDKSFNIFENDVKVITIHSAKGLEFPVVIIMNVEEGEIPRNIEHIQNNEDLDSTLRSERQLLYVAMTRAADELCMIVREGRGSRFIDDIPDDLLRKKTWNDYLG